MKQNVKLFSWGLIFSELFHIIPITTEGEKLGPNTITRPRNVKSIFPV